MKIGIVILISLMLSGCAAGIDPSKLAFEIKSGVVVAPVRLEYAEFCEKIGWAEIRVLRDKACSQFYAGEQIPKSRVLEETKVYYHVAEKQSFNLLTVETNFGGYVKKSDLEVGSKRVVGIACDYFVMLELAKNTHNLAAFEAVFNANLNKRCVKLSSEDFNAAAVDSHEVYGSLYAGGPEVKTARIYAKYIDGQKVWTF